ncbi:serine hydrolase domain-containing protein [Streptosporangium sp. NPDC004379]|uniref:serine hydrolase domain-containing protein n=1 Tax=Streptosporangium sp. NPDC004379 TaxID=3366189 RepID=UPI0036880D1D
MSRTVAIALAVTAFLGAAAPAHATTRPRDDLAEVRRTLDGIVAAGAPGVLARVDDDEGAWIGTGGVADLTTRAPMPPQARFRVASLTKSVVATVVLQLVQEGKVRLDDPIAALLPGLIRDGDRVTVRRLLNHTGGLADYMEHAEFADPGHYARRAYRPERLVAYAEQVERPEPGAFHYSNAGYIVLGMLVEKVTGHTLSAEVDRRILGPARMTRSYLPVTDPRIHGPHATGYYLPEGADTDGLRPLTRIDPSWAWAAFGLVSDGRDVNRFYRALFGGRLIGPRLLAEMRTGVGTPQAPVFPRYGLGLEAVALTCGEKWGATGSIPGYVTFGFADDTGRRRMTISVNVQRNDPRAGLLILAAVNSLNQYFCGEPYEMPRG